MIRFDNKWACLSRSLSIDRFAELLLILNFCCVVIVVNSAFLVQLTLCDKQETISSSARRRVPVHSTSAEYKERPYSLISYSGW